MKEALNLDSVVLEAISMHKQVSLLTNGISGKHSTQKWVIC